jgi:hypothetical protein
LSFSTNHVFPIVIYHILLPVCFSMVQYKLYCEFPLLLSLASPISPSMRLFSNYIALSAAFHFCFEIILNFFLLIVCLSSQHSMSLTPFLPPSIPPPPRIAKNKMSTITIYVNWASQPCRSVHRICDLNGITDKINWKIIDFKNSEHLSESFLKINQARTVPVLVETSPGISTKITMMMFQQN